MKGDYERLPEVFWGEGINTLFKSKKNVFKKGHMCIFIMDIWLIIYVCMLSLSQFSIINYQSEHSIRFPPPKITCTYPPSTPFYLSLHSFLYILSFLLFSFFKSLPILKKKLSIYIFRNSIFIFCLGLA